MLSVGFKQLYVSGRPPPREEDGSDADSLAGMSGSHCSWSPQQQQVDPSSPPAIALVEPSSPTCARRSALRVRKLQRSDTPPRIRTSSRWCSIRSSVGLAAVVLVLVLNRYLGWQPALLAQQAAAGGSLAANALEEQWAIARRRGALNVLYIVLEDFGVLGTSVFPSPGGAPNGTTPHLERLSARGVTFRKA